MHRSITLPAPYHERIERLLQLFGASLAAPRRLAAAVQRLSDHYIQNPNAPTPWHQEWAAVAYACYFFPLNYLRVRGVINTGCGVDFWQGLQQFTDFGSGVGTVPLAFADALPGHFRAGLAIERAAAAPRFHRELAGGPCPELRWVQVPPGGRPGTLTVFSFALTELAALPAWALAGEAIALIEPATNQDGRRLLQLRAELLALGWHVWAPCTHAASCPLLTESARDWCHDRIHWEAPEWFLAIEEHLPMRNRSLAYSYLLLRRTPPAQAPALARLTGDLLRQKGASKQMLCRGPKREFLSWQHKQGTPPHWPRGARVRLHGDTLQKGNELRPTPLQIALVDDC